MAEQWHRELIDNLPHYVFSVDDRDRYVTVNRAACLFFGRPESEIVGRTAIELGIPADVAEQWLEQNRIVRTVGETRVFDEILRTVDGDARHIQAILSPVRDESGNIAGVSGISIDLTDLKTAEATAHGLLGAIEQLDEVMFTTDRNGTITYVNPAFERVYGYPREEAVGKTPRILKSGELPGSTYQQLWSELVAGRSVRMEYRNRAKDGSVVEVIGSASPVLSDKKNVIGFIGAGTTFRLYFPIVDEGTDAADRIPQADVRGGTESLLVVEDEAQFRDTLATHLRIRGYQVTTAADGLEAIERLRALPEVPDAVVMDLGMPKMQAAELLARLRVRTRRGCGSWRRPATSTPTCTPAFLRPECATWPIPQRICCSCCA